MASQNGRLKGLQRAKDSLNRRLKKIGQVAFDALIDVGLDSMGEAARRAPVDKGDLRASATLEVEGQNGFGWVVARTLSNESGGVGVVEGGRPAKEGGTVTVAFNTPYAVRQHEETGYFHPKGGQAKYAESVLVERADRYVKYIAEKSRREAGE